MERAQARGPGRGSGGRRALLRTQAVLGERPHRLVPRVGAQGWHSGALSRSCPQLDPVAVPWKAPKAVPGALCHPRPLSLLPWCVESRSQDLFHCFVSWGGIILVSGWPRVLGISCPHSVASAPPLALGACRVEAGGFSRCPAGPPGRCSRHLCECRGQAGPAALRQPEWPRLSCGPAVGGWGCCAGH